MKKRIVALFIIFTFLFVSIPETYAASKVGKVSGVKQIGADYGSITLSWNKAKKAKQYKVYVSTKSSKKKFKCKATTSGTSTTITGLKPGQKVWVKVRGKKGKKYGKYSKVVVMYAGTNSAPPADIVTYDGGSPVTWTSYYGQNIQFYLPGGFATSFNDSWAKTWKRDSSYGLEFIDISNYVSDTTTLDYIRTSYPNGTNATYNGISGYEYSPIGDPSFLTFAFEAVKNGETILYEVEVNDFRTNDSRNLLHAVLTQLKVLN